MYRDISRPRGVFTSMGILEPPVGGPQTVSQLRWGIELAVVETSIGTQGTRIALSQRLHGGNPGPDNGMCCGGLPIQRHSETDG